MTAWDDMVLVGRIARTQGRHGEVIVNADTDFPEARFAPGAVLQVLRGGTVGTLRVGRVRFHMGRPVIGFEGVETMNDAEALAGLELRIPAAALTPLPEGSYYVHDLVGCDVRTRDGRDVGPVRAVEGEAGAARLVVGEGRGEVQIPLTVAICVEIDPAARRIVIDPPPGLLDLNA